MTDSPTSYYPPASIGALFELGSKSPLVGVTSESAGRTVSIASVSFTRTPLPDVWQVQDAFKIELEINEQGARRALFSERRISFQAVPSLDGPASQPDVADSAPAAPATSDVAAQVEQVLGQSWGEASLPEALIDALLLALCARPSPGSLERFFHEDLLRVLAGPGGAFTISTEEGATVTLAVLSLAIERKELGLLGNVWGRVRILCRLEAKSTASGELLEVTEQELALDQTVGSKAFVLPAPSLSDPYLERVVSAWREGWRQAATEREDPSSWEGVFPHDVVSSVPVFELLAKYAEAGAPGKRPLGRCSLPLLTDLAARATVRSATEEERELLEGPQIVAAIDHRSSVFFLASGPYGDDDGIEQHASLWLARPSSAPMLVFFLGWDGSDWQHFSSAGGDTSRALAGAIRQAAMRSAPDLVVSWDADDEDGELTEFSDTLDRWLVFFLDADRTVIDWRVEPDRFDVAPALWLERILPIPRQDERESLLALLGGPIV